MEVDGGEVSLTNYGRTRDSRFRSIFSKSDVPAGTQAGISLHCNKSDLVSRRTKSVSEIEFHNSETGRGSPPTFLEIATLTTSSRISMIEYITTNNRR
jgi:hypothetical protein